MYTQPSGWRGVAKFTAPFCPIISHYHMKERKEMRGMRTCSVHSGLLCKRGSHRINLQLRHLDSIRGHAYCQPTARQTNMETNKPNSITNLRLKPDGPPFSFLLGKSSSSYLQARRKWKLKLSSYLQELGENRKDKMSACAHGSTARQHHPILILSYIFRYAYVYVYVGHPCMCMCCVLHLYTLG